MVVVPLKTDSGAPINIKTARKLYGRTASINNKKIGRVFDIIGRVESPYLVIRLLRNLENLKPNSLIGRKISII